MTDPPFSIEHYETYGIHEVIFSWNGKVRKAVSKDKEQAFHLLAEDVLHMTSGLGAYAKTVFMKSMLEELYKGRGGCFRVQVIREEDPFGHRKDSPLAGCIPELECHIGKRETKDLKEGSVWWEHGKEHIEVGEYSYCTIDEYHWYMELETVEELWDVIRKTYGSFIYHGGYPAILLPEGYDVEEEDID